MKNLVGQIAVGCWLVLATTALGAIRENDPSAARLLLEAQRLDQAGDLNAAREAFELVAERFPASQQAEEALLLLARAHSARGDAGPARLAAEKLTSQYPQSPIAPDAYLLLADLQVASAANPADLEAATTVLKRIPLLFPRSGFPNLTARQVARMRAAELDSRLGQSPAAAAAFVAAIEDEPRSPWTSRARIGLARILIQEDDWMAAAEVLQAVIDASETPGAEDADAEATAQARRTQTAIHRLALRPRTGTASWKSARQLAIPGETFERPVGVSAAPDDRIVIVDRGRDTVLELAAGGAVIRRRQAKSPSRPWWHEDQAFVADGPEIRRLEDLRTWSFVPSSDSRRQPLRDVVAGERGAFGQWYLLDGAANRVQVFIPSGAFLNELAAGEPIDLAQDSRGRLYVLDRKSRQVQRFDPNGTPLGIVARGDWRKPEAIAIDPLDRLYVLDRESARIDIFAGGAKVASIGPLLPGGIELRGPTDLAIDGSGRVYVADGRLSAIVVLE